MYFYIKKQETIFGLQIKSLFHKLNLLYVSLLTPIRDSNPCLPLHEGTLDP